MNRSKAGLILLLCAATSCTSSDPEKAGAESRWNRKYDFVRSLPIIRFHYDHGVLADSYEPGLETAEVRFDDVCRYLGHVCLCGAGGFRISQIAVQMLKTDEHLLEKGDFILISSRDHTVSDVIAYVLGCSRRHDPEKNQYIINEKTETVRREYHYFIGYRPQRKAVHIIYRKHLLIGNEMMDRLWNVELSYDKNPAAVSPSDLELYQNTMFEMVKEVLTGQKIGLFEAKTIGYDAFANMWTGLTRSTVLPTDHEE